MNGRISESEIERVAWALGDSPRVSYAAPHVYPWAVRNFEARPHAARPHPSPGAIQLYVHIPFCNYHCSFCFYAVRGGATLDEMERYVAAIERELDWAPPGTTLSRMFVGGGTPTALPPALLDRVLGAIFDRIGAPTRHAHTVEASPESITEAHLRVLLDRGIGRLSIGIQSLDDAVLGSLHRRHSPAQALDACRMVVDSGLVLNIDLIYGLPGQTEDSFSRDLEAIAAAGVPSLCLYTLRLNENTPVARQLTPEERLDLARLMRWRVFVKQAAERVGYTQGRTYAFKRLDSEATRLAPAPPARDDGMSYQLGIGMSARSQLGSVVYRNHARTSRYMEWIERGESPVESVFELDAEDRKTQFLAGSLCNAEPLERSAYQRLFGSSVDGDFGEWLDRFRRAELVEDDGASMVLTERGKLVYDRMLLCFYPPRAKRWLSERAEAPRAS